MRFALAIALGLVSFTSCLTRIQAQPTKPVNSPVRFIPPPAPNLSAPSGRQRGGASRGECPNVEKPLTALVPATQKSLDSGVTSNPALSTFESVWGLTVAEHPTLWFYVPYSLTSKLPIEFVLQDDQNKDVYKTSFSASQMQPGIVSLRLPSTEAPLKVGKNYHWYFIINCNPDAPPVVEGWVQRVALNPTLASQLQKATPRQRAALYAREGIWHDALTTLAELRSANPGDATLSNDWVSLLQSVRLEAIAAEPIVECCTQETGDRRQ